MFHLFYLASHTEAQGKAEEELGKENKTNDSNSEEKEFVFSLATVFSDNSSTNFDTDTMEKDIELKKKDVKTEREGETRIIENVLSEQENNGFTSSFFGPEYGKLDIVIKTLEEKQISDQKLFYNKLLKSSIRNSTENLNTECEDCLIQFENFDQLNRHTESYHKEYGLLDCPICGKLNLTDSQISIHQSIHTSGKHFECEFCLKGFNQKDEMTRHIHETHKENIRERYICR